MLIRSRLVARDFKGDDKDRDDLFAGTPANHSHSLRASRHHSPHLNQLVIP